MENVNNDKNIHGDYMSYKCLIINEINKIDILSKESCSSRRTAKTLGLHHFTISIELKKCG